MGKKVVATGDPVYVVTMYRWGKKEKHSYVLGCYRKKTRANKEVDAEVDARGGKYVPEIVEMRMDFDRHVHCKIIRALSVQEVASG